MLINSQDIENLLRLIMDIMDGSELEEVAWIMPCFISLQT